MSLKKVVVAAVTILVICGLACPVAVSTTCRQQREERQPRPIKLRGLLDALHAGGLSQAEIITRVKERGVDFALTQKLEAMLRNAGASEPLIRAIRNAQVDSGVVPAGPSASASKPSGRQPNSVKAETASRYSTNVDAASLQARKPFYYGNGADDTRIEQRIKSYEKEVRLHPNSVDAYFRLGEVYRNHGYHEYAVREYRTAIRMRPGLAEAHYGLGECCQSLSLNKPLGQSSELYALAGEAFKNAIRLKPDYAEAHLGLGDAYSNLDRDEEALGELELAIRIRPDYRDAYERLGLAYWLLARKGESRLADDSLTKGIDALKKAIGIAPNFSMPYHWLGLCYQRQNRFDEALATYLSGDQRCVIKPCTYSS
jgi:tetratricopeptide (TPR) repeat protein